MAQNLAIAQPPVKPVSRELAFPSHEPGREPQSRAIVPGWTAEMARKRRRVLVLVITAFVAICFVVFWIEPLAALGVIERLTPSRSCSRSVC